MVTEPHDGIDPYNNQESKAREAGEAPLLARGGANVTAESGHAPADEQPGQQLAGGTAGGSPLEGVLASDDDLADSVSGDTGPENPGERRG